MNVSSIAVRYLLAVALVGLISLQAPTAPADEDDPFAAPSPATKKTHAPKKKRNPTEERIDFQVKASPDHVQRGQVFRLTITGTPKPGFHTYPLTERAADQDPSGLSFLRFEESPVLKPLWPVSESAPEVEVVKGVGTFLEHRRPFTWSQDVLVLPNATLGPNVLSFHIKLQVCDQTCVWGEHQLQATVRVTDGPAAVLTPELKNRLEEKPPQPKVVTGLDASASAQASAAASRAAPAKGGEERGLLGLLLASMGAAVAMLLTPCVFPMIPITVSFFLKQSEKEHHNALLTAAVYSLTIIIVLALAVLLLGQLIVEWANSAWLNLGLGGVLVYFALSLFGMYEIELPSGWTRFTSAHEGKGGYVGAVFMALTFTITSFTCTGPFLGPLLVTVKEYQLTFGERLLGAGLYATTFAAPFFVLALFPSLLKSLPKSGGWLNGVKVVMGFLELAAALKFLANTDLAWNPGNPWFFNYETVLCAWIALSLACGCYLLGFYRLPHDTPLDHLGVVRMLLAACFFGLAVYMVPLLWRITPQGLVGQGLVAFLPLDTRDTPRSAQAGAEELTWLRDYQQAWDLANRDNKLIFIDFTGTTCVNCRYNEKNVFPEPAVRAGLSRYVRVQLYTDYVPDPRLSASESQRQGERNNGWRSETFGDVTNPLYAVIRPAKDSPFEEFGPGKQKLKGEILGVRKGQIKDYQVHDFEDFLNEPLKQATARRGAGELATVP
jgi:thiol:disulfide interchange protein DsbD